MDFNSVLGRVRLLAGFRAPGLRTEAEGLLGGPWDLVATYIAGIINLPTIGAGPYKPI